MAVTVKHADVEMHVGDKIKVHVIFTEGEKKKVQAFEGILMIIRGKGENKMITVRKVTKDKVGVERIFPISSPAIEKIEVVSKGATRRSKIRFIRNLSDKQLRDSLSTK